MPGIARSSPRPSTGSWSWPPRCGRRPRSCWASPAPGRSAGSSRWEGWGRLPARPCSSPTCGGGSVCLPRPDGDLRPYDPPHNVPSCSPPIVRLPTAYEEETMKRALVIATGLAVMLAASAAAQMWNKEAAGKAPATTVSGPAELPEVKAIVTAPPLVPPPVDRPGNARVIVSLDTVEKRGTLADGVEYTFWTFG